MEIKRLTPSEISNLWNSYVTNSMGIWVTRHFIETTQDEKMLDMLHFTLRIAIEQTDQSKSFLQEAGHPLPEPFDDSDVNINAKPLFTDNYVVLLKYSLSQAAMTVYSLSLNTSIRHDIRVFYKQCLHNSSELVIRCADLMIEKGQQQPEIHIPTPNSIEKVNSQQFLAGWFGNKRPINSQEIGQIVYNYRATEIHKEFIRGAAQVTKSKELKKHYQRGLEIFQKHLDLFQTMLSEYELPQLPTWESEVMDTTTSPFSERLMHFKHAALTSQASARYGAAMSSVMRRDIGADFMRLMGETLKYGEDAAELMIKHKFLDQLPMAKEKQ